jgi:hypothetical protein
LREGDGVGDAKECAGDGRSCVVEDCARVWAEVVDAGANGGGADGNEAARGFGNLAGSAVGVERAVDEEMRGHAVVSKSRFPLGMTNREMQKGRGLVWRRPFGFARGRQKMSSTPFWVVGEHLRAIFEARKQNTGILSKAQNDNRKDLQRTHVVQELLVVAGLGELVGE